MTVLGRFWLLVMLPFWLLFMALFGVCTWSPVWAIRQGVADWHAEWRYQTQFRRVR